MINGLELIESSPKGQIGCSANEGDLKKCGPWSFLDGDFIEKIRERSLQPGESVRGWAFFEWPDELRIKSLKIDKMRIWIIDENGKSSSVITPIKQEGKEFGQSVVWGKIEFWGLAKIVDLSSVPIRGCAPRN